ncbi:MAG: PaaX family transcriptional regulator C-terminal domain-containing protein [Anaerolineae bacterium]|jgi:phenylacetic acid degradation operon negative regulatory protein
MAQTQNLILRIVAQRGAIGSADLAEVAQKFGLSSDAVRAAANRMARAGLLEKAGRGRGNVHYKVGPKGQTIVNQFIVKLMHWHLALEGQQAWDGTWLVVAFSVPEEQRVKRDLFRDRLIEMGFGLLSSSVWISPFDQEADVASLVGELSLDGMVAILHCDHIQMPGLASVRELAGAVWDLEPLAEHYRDLNRRVEAFTAFLEQLGQGGEIDAEAIFFAAMDLQNEVMEMILTEDPCLPPELLPSEWPGQRTHELAHAVTAAIDRLEQVSEQYEYLFHLIQGMEVLEVFRDSFEGDVGFHWPEEEAAG